MKISYLLPDFGKSGGFIVIYNFMDHLVKKGHKVYAIYPDKKVKWKAGRWKKEINNANSMKFSILKSFYDNIKNERTDKIKYFYILKNITEGLLNNWVNSDATISTYCLTTYAGYFLSERTVPFYHMQHYEEIFFQNNMERFIARNTYELPLIKMSNSTWLRELVKKNFNSDSYLLNPGIDLSLFKPYNDPEEKYQNKKIWTIVSLIDETRDWKGFSDASTAVKNARTYLFKEGIELKWKVFGLFPPKNKYDTEFEYVGPIFGSKLANLYSKADIVLVTSWYESFPLPPIESMACGSLILTTKYGTEDYVFHNKNGLVALPRKIDEITSNIIKAVLNPQKSLSMVKNGLDTVQNYNWISRTSNLENILKNGLNKYSFDKFKLLDDLVKGKFSEYMYDEFK